MQVIQTTKVA